MAAPLGLGPSLVVAFAVLSVGIVAATGFLILYRLYNRRSLKREAETRRANIIKHGFGISPPGAATLTYDAHRPSVHGWGVLPSSDDLLNRHPALRSETSVRRSRSSTSVRGGPLEPAQPRPLRLSPRKPAIPAKSSLRPQLSSLAESPKGLSVADETLSPSRGRSPGSRKERDCSTDSSHQPPKLSVQLPLVPLETPRSSPSRLRAPQLLSKGFEPSQRNNSQGSKCTNSRPSSVTLVSPKLGQAGQEFKQRNPEVGLGIHIREHQSELNDTLYGKADNNSKVSQPVLSTNELEQSLEALNMLSETSLTDDPSFRPTSIATGSTNSLSGAKLRTAEGLEIRRVSGGNERESSSVRLLNTPKRDLHVREVSTRRSPNDKHRSMMGRMPTTEGYESVPSAPDMSSRSSLLRNEIFNTSNSELPLEKDEQLTTEKSDTDSVKTHRRQNCVRIDLRPTFLHAQGQDLDGQGPSQGENTQAEQAVSTLQSADDSRTTRSQTPEQIFSFHPEGRQGHTSLTPSSPTLSMSQYFHEEALAGLQHQLEDYGPMSVSTSNFYHYSDSSSRNNNYQYPRISKQVYSAPSLVDMPMWGAGPRVVPRSYVPRHLSPRNSTYTQPRILLGEMQSPIESYPVTRGRRTPSRTNRLKQHNGSPAGKSRRPATPLSPHFLHSAADVAANAPVIRPTRVTPLSTVIDPMRGGSVAIGPYPGSPRSLEGTAQPTQELLRSIMRLRRMNSETMRTPERTAEQKFYIGVGHGSPGSSSRASMVRSRYSLEDKENSLGTGANHALHMVQAFPEKRIDLADTLPGLLYDENGMLRSSP